MNSKEQTKASKFLSLVLRHKPETIDIQLDPNGWADVDQLLDKMNRRGFDLNLVKLRTIVELNDKKRFILSEDGMRIRANQGHSITVDLNLAPKTPPSILYHGTALKNRSSIEASGLLKGQRHHVHLSDDQKTALNVGQRYGRPIILTILADRMHTQGFKFFQSENGVWLTDAVPPEFIEWTV